MPSLRGKFQETSRKLGVMVKRRNTHSDEDPAQGSHDFKQPRIMTKQDAGTGFPEFVGGMNNVTN